jgi:aspartyl-tRNA(Asn)/glutamyl-tRNA(Gln) amidotransferase subunit A
MTQTVGDAALLLEVISGFDPRDPRTRLAPDPQFVSRHLEDGVSGLRIGVPRYALDNVDAAVAGLVRGALSALEGMGAALVEVDLPSPGRHEEVFRVIAGLEVLAWHAPCISVSGDRYSPATRERIEAAGGFGPSDYIEARQSCMALQAAVLECFDQVDLLALPASPMPASPLGQDPVDVAGSSERVLLALTRFNRLFSVTGFPAISVPCGLTGARLPAGLQLAGRPFDEERVLRAARAYEREVGGFPLPPPEPADPGSSG